MTEKATNALLPAGLRDVLPPEAAHEARVVEALLAQFAAHGYERVRPPLVEFEESLLAGSGAAMASQTFRLMDPVSQRMMGVRADITIQIARIAATRLAGAPRPLRLSYAGEVLRVRGSQLVPERQLCQVGVELIGAASAEADAEVISMAAEALGAFGVNDLSADLTSPRLVPALVSALGLETGDGDLRDALDHKDAARVAAAAGSHAKLFGALLAAAGPADHALAALQKLDLPRPVKAEANHLAEVVRLVRTAIPALDLTIDPVENRGFEYHTGVSFSLFVPGVRGELGRGGRYVAGAPFARRAKGAGETVGAGEPATGFTLAMETVLQALPDPEPARRLFVPVGTPPETMRRLRIDGWAVVAGLAPVQDAKREAVRLGCAHALVDGKIVAAAK
ncbi:MAG: ATP phosphoribosyltransferase regulatory subunit [Alphaproteobacteria bacterium]